MPLNFPAVSVVVIWAVAWCLTNLIAALPDAPWTWRNAATVTTLVLAIIFILLGGRAL